MLHLFRNTEVSRRLLQPLQEQATQGLLWSNLPENTQNYLLAALKRYAAEANHLQIVAIFQSLQQLNMEWLSLASDVQASLLQALEGINRWDTDTLKSVFFSLAALKISYMQLSDDLQEIVRDGLFHSLMTDTMKGFEAMQHMQLPKDAIPSGAVGRIVRKRDISYTHTKRVLVFLEGLGMTVDPGLAPHLNHKLEIENSHKLSLFYSTLLNNEECYPICSQIRPFFSRIGSFLTGLEQAHPELKRLMEPGARIEAQRIFFSHGNG